MNPVRRLGRWTIARIARLGRASLFLYQILMQVWRLAPRLGLLIQQIYAVGVLTLLIILVSGLFVGMVLGLQGYNTLVDFGAESALGLLVAAGKVRAPCNTP